ncbi:UbiH/UbiF/VisC/COQ6 family ubiquinone biosynthesis hydroxylase [Caedibacter taeniospiralis]|uniref:UbiH/UbiF/VisC/COQ6 family ubiquinone biosynthesis hydroxylase n=1 Tax=Caedibacter taeniospiralis TaxID=28907 RepID=UPI000C2788E1|nr:UbiH/UbiF/VisC/COQ6 family ubiquinone biosynthesis hydroxylase [Caedibacter taeniospiralis]
MQYEVIVVGAGMAGLTCALGLAQSGFKVAIIEANKIAKDFEITQSIKRVSAINQDSQQLLRKLSVWQDMIELRASDYVGMEVWDQNSSAKLEFKAHDFSLMSLGTIIENDLIVAKLYQRLKAMDVHFFEGVHITEVSQSHYTNMLKLADDLMLECQLIVGADGAHSFIRQFFRFSCKHMPYQHRAIVANIRTQKKHANIAYQRFLRNGVLAFLPLSQPDVCSIVYSVNTQQAGDFLAMNDAAFSDHISIALEGRLGELKTQSPRMSFELIERHTERYCQDGVVLIADAAHTIHPLAGQGINLGFADVKALIDVLNEAKAQKRNIAAMSTLAKYERKRRFDNQLMIEMMRGLKRLFCNDNLLLRPLRELGMNPVNNNRLLKRFFIERAAGL